MVSKVWVRDPTGTIGVGINPREWTREGGHFFDAERREPWEPYGFIALAWLPTRCRNGRVRWLTFLERHDDGTYTRSRIQR